MIFKQVLVISGLLVLGACASTGSSGGGEASSGLESAKINTSLGNEYLSRGQYEIALEKLKKATRLSVTKASASAWVSGKTN